MKKQFILLSSLCSLGMIAQHSEQACGFDDYVKHHHHTSQENGKTSNLKTKGDNFFNQLSNFSTNFHSLSTNSTFTPYSGPIYEIPVVVHIIESDYVGQITDNRTLKLSDEQVKTWIENANKMYATTYGNGFFPEGEGSKGGAVIPFRLVLAQRTQDLQPTTGIYRYNGDHIAGYGPYGVRNGISDPNYGPSAGDIVKEFPHWQEDLYYNIYIVVGIDGNKADTGAAGFAGMPNYGNNGYHTFVAASRITKKDDVFLAHEFGHSLGLLHPFHGGSATTCPTGDNDGIADTEPIKSFPCVEDTNGDCIRAVEENDINPCTNEKYQGTQYNIMGYSYEPRKFTTGQREKILQEFFRNDRGKNLVKSRGGEPITETSEITLTPMTCSPSDFRWFSSNKTRKITFGDIESNVNNSTFYTDYTNNSSLRRGSYTDLIENQSHTLTIESEAGNNFHAWIDYNNNGTFEESERITPNAGLIIPANKKASIDITPSADAIKNTYLRLRILTDEYVKDACATDFIDGNINDFAVRIIEEKTIEPEPEIVPEPQPEPTPSPENENYFGRVGINTDKPKATLHIKETPIDQLPAGQPQGVLFPNFTSEERALFQNVAEGTMIYNTTLRCLEIYKNTKWQCIGK